MLLGALGQCAVVLQGFTTRLHRLAAGFGGAALGLFTAITIVTIDQLLDHGDALLAVFGDGPHRKGSVGLSEYFGAFGHAEHLKALQRLFSQLSVAVEEEL
ncbi:hypothetical protein D3C72_1610350 [compost metagenome]